MRFYVPFLSLLADNPLDYSQLFPLTIAEFCDYACKVAGCYLETPAFLARCSFGPDNLPYNGAMRNMPLGSPERGSQWISQFPTITLDEAKSIVEKAGIKVKINEGYEEGVAYFASILGTPALNPDIVVRADNYLTPSTFTHRS